MKVEPGRVSLREITADTAIAVTRLAVAESQKGFVAPNAVSLAQALFAPEAFVGEVVMKQEMTAFLAAVQARGCRFQVGSDMLFEQIPAYLEFFGLPSTTAETLRSVARLSY